MAGFSAIDLSQLPAPDVVETIDFEDILAAMKTDLLARDPTLTAVELESEPAAKVLEAAAYREVVVRQRVNDAARAVMLAFSAGDDLTNLGALLNVSRLELDPGDPSAIPPVDPTYESDSAFRLRVQLAMEGLSNAGTRGAYVFHASSADPTVKDIGVQLHTPQPGDVTVTVLSTVGDGTPDAALLTAVNSALNDQDVRPLNDTVYVQGPTVTNYTIVATLTFYSGPDASVVRQAAEDAVNAYVEARHRIGQDVTLSGVYAALHQPGVQNVALTSPAADIVIDDGEVAFCTSVTVTAGGTGA